MMKIMKKRTLLSVVMAVILLVSSIPVGSALALTACDVLVLHNGIETDRLTLKEDGEELLVAAVQHGDVDSYKWQICADHDAGRWVTIADRRAASCKVNYALVKNQLSNNTAYLRCVVTNGDIQYTSDEVAVTVSLLAPKTDAVTAESAESSVKITPSMAKLRTKARAAIANTYNVTVEYMFSDGVTPAWEPERFNVQADSELVAAVTLPTIIGYVPKYDAAAGGSLDLTSGLFNISLDAVTADITYTVIYEPALTTYKVIHHLQKLDTDGYGDDIIEERKGLTGTQVPGTLHKSGDPTGENYDARVTGFTHLAYRNLTIAADGQTVIHIYYNREYFLVEYLLESDAYGIESIAVRFGTSIVAKDPRRPGWDFAAWELVGCRLGPEVDGKATYIQPTAEQKDDLNINVRTITVPAFDIQFIPTWTQGESSFSVVYWKEVANSSEEDVQYEYWKSEAFGYDTLTDGSIQYNGTVTTGMVVTPQTPVSSGSNVMLKDVPLDADDEKEYPFFEYNAEKSEGTVENPVQVMVSGDGTSVLNVYYDRKEYTLKFYYGASDANGYYVSGRTNRFGTEANSRWSKADDVNNEIDLYDNAWGNYRCQVKALPALTELRNDARFTFGEDISHDSSSRKYHYFTFKANYGDNISELWPTTSVVSSVEMNSAYTYSGNTYTHAIFSGWNGEYSAYYTQNRDTEFDGNETVKGQYRKLDHRILWTAERAETYADEYNNTVSFLAFWSNAARASWAVPSLYRYNVYLECLRQHAADTTCAQCAATGMKTFTVDGTTLTYYRAETYDVADNMDTSGNANLQEQTSPPVEGFVNVNDSNGTSLVSGTEYNTLTAGTEGNTYDAAAYRNGYEIYWFYNRDKFELKFNNMGFILQNKDADGNPVDHVLIRYGVSLYSPNESYNLNDNPNNYPVSLEAGGYEFTGWYTSPIFAEGTEYTFSEGDTMPAHNMELYARWEKKQHKVYVYRQEADIAANNPLYPGRAPSVVHNELSPTPSDPAPVNEGESFVGWYYRDENGEEQRFIFSSMKIKHEMHIYAKFESMVAVPYTIYFVAAEGLDANGDPIAKMTTDENGDPIPVYVADPREAWAVANTDVTVFAKAENELYADYRQHWFPQILTQDLKLTVDGDNTKTVYYLQKEIVPYKVRYVDENGADLREPKLVTDNRNTVVTESFQPVAGYMPDALQKRLIVSATDDAVDENGITAANTIVFEYSVATNETVVQVVEYIETLTDGVYVEANSTVSVIDKSQQTTFTHTVAERIGFSFVPEKTDINGGTDVDGYFASIGASVVPMSEGNAGAVTVALYGDGNLIKIYYDRNTVNYSISHLEIGTDTPLADEQVGSGKYGAVVSASYKNILGYKLVAGQEPYREMTLGDGSNSLVFYYQQEDVTISYVAMVDGAPQEGWLTKETTTVKALADSVSTANGSAPLAGDVTVVDGVQYQFGGWYRDEACTMPVNVAWVDENDTLIPQRLGVVFTPTTYYAKFTPSMATLSIRTEFPIQQGEYSSIDPNKTFIFKVRGTDEWNSDVLMTVSIHGKGKSCVTNLPLGHYEITYLSDWNWRYNPTNGQATKNVTLTADGLTETVVLARTSGKWLDGDNYQENIFGQ